MAAMNVPLCYSSFFATPTFSVLERGHPAPRFPKYKRPAASPAEVEERRAARAAAMAAYEVELQAAIKEAEETAEEFATLTTVEIADILLKKKPSPEIFNALTSRMDPLLVEAAEDMANEMMWKQLDREEEQEQERDAYY